MAVRFRIRTPAGQELSFASQEMFEDFVRSGDLSPDDLVYDGETGSWSPARTHPTVLEVQYEEDAADELAPGEQASAAEAEQGSAGVGGAPRPVSTDEPDPDLEDDQAAAEKQAVEDDQALEEEDDLDLEDDLGLDLALHEEESPEEAKRKLIEKLEAERRSELDAGGGIRESLTGFMVDPGASELTRTEGPGERRPPPSEPPRPSEPPPPSEPARRSEPARPSREPSPPSRGAKRPRERRPRGTSPALAGKSSGPRPSTPAPDPGTRRGGLGRVLFVLIVLGLLAAGAYVGYRALEADPPPPQEPPETSEAEAEAMPDPDPPVVGVVDETEAAPPARDPVIADTEAAVRERTRERYLASTQVAFRDLRPIPEAWPGGTYLSVPSDHPDVVDVWQHYRTTVGEVRATDEERYRAALEMALDDAGLDGGPREARRDAVLAGFEASAPLLAAHYDRVEALATAALQSHDALMEAEGLLIYDPTGSTASEEGIGRGVSARDAGSQLLLDQVVELLTASLDAEGRGPGSPENVREWVWDGFLDAATR